MILRGTVVYPDITNQLRDVLNRVDKAYAKLTSNERDNLEKYLYDPIDIDTSTMPPYESPANGSWDILQLTNSLNQDQWVDDASIPQLNGDPHNRFVRVNNQTFHTYAVNYVLFGRLSRLLADDHRGRGYSGALGFTFAAKWLNPFSASQEWTATRDWMDAGWNGWNAGKWGTPQSNIISRGNSGLSYRGQFEIGNYFGAPETLKNMVN